MTKEQIKQELISVFRAAEFAEKSYIEVDVSMLKDIFFYLYNDSSHYTKEELASMQKPEKVDKVSRIYKYVLRMEDEQVVLLPSKPISAEVQNQTIVLYAVHNEGIEPKPYLIRIAGTGHPIVDIENFEFLTTVSPVQGLFFHVFYKQFEG